jgi:hypothetical protein
LAEAEKMPALGRFTATLVRGLMAPADEALRWLEGQANLGREGETFVGELSERSAVELAGAVPAKPLQPGHRPIVINNPQSTTRTKP